MTKALIISLQYNKFPDAKLNGCFYDGERFFNKLKQINENMNIIFMRDDLAEDSEFYPTKNNIINQLNKLCESQDNKLYFYFSGHGSYKNDTNKDEITTLFTANGLHNLRLNSLLKDSCLVSNDFDNLNLVSDDELYNILLKLNKNQTLYSFMDCCHSGTMLDLCHLYVGNIKRQIKYNNKYQLIRNSISNCKITSSYYPDKFNKMNGNVILISGTRDNAYAYESVIDKQPQGHFTTVLIKAINLGLLNYSIGIFYLCLIGLINNKAQIPVLSSSKNINLNKYKLDLRRKRNFNSLLLLKEKSKK